MISFVPRVDLKRPYALVLMTRETAQAGRFTSSVTEVTAAVKALLKSGRFEGQKGEMFPLIVGKVSLLLLGLGKEKELTPTALRVLLRRALLAPLFKKAAQIDVVPHADTLETGLALIDAHILGTYAWKKYVTRKPDDTTVDQKDLRAALKPRPEYGAAIIVAACANFARDLVNENADVTSAQFLERTVRDLVKGKAHVKLEVLDRKQLAARKFGLLLAVNKGSSKEPRVVIARYTGGQKNDPYTAFVGKGLTYDTGGLNLKPSGSMETMRSDMAGAAAVIGALKATLALQPKKNVIFAFGAVENAVDANAFKPGDVYVGYAGKSVEIGNTDAEGRLVLADVISYLIDVHQPARLIDLATLTGACVVALGHDYAGLLANHEDLARAVETSAQATDDRVWRLPLYPELKEMIKSKIADVKNISNQRGSAGTMTAAEFLRTFVGDKTPWAHIDIAGTAFVDGDGRMYYGHGATGFGVRLIMDLIRKD